MKVLAFAASNSLTSINKQLVQYTATILKDEISPDADVEVIDLNDFEMHIYRPDREEQSGIPAEAQRFFEKIGGADALIISFAEHNGNYTSAYKNLFDWTSRINMKVYQDKPTVIMGASPGPGGAGTVLNVAQQSAPFFGMDVKASVSVPSFQDHFDFEAGKITSAEIRTDITQALKQLK